MKTPLPTRRENIALIIMNILALAIIASGCYSYKTVERVYHNGQWYDKAELEKANKK